MMSILLFLACAPADDPTLEGADLLPPCTLAEPGDRLQFAEACADGVCDGMRYVDIVAAIGEPDRCHDDSSSGTYTFCYWMDDTLHTLFDGADGDGIPDPESIGGGIYVSQPWDGTSAEGLGVGMSLACFLEAYGEPSNVFYREVRGVRNIYEFYISEVGLYVTDGYSDEKLDGIVSHLGLYGPR